MKVKDLEKLDIEGLKKKEKAGMVLTGIFIPIIILLFYFSLRDYFNGEEVEMSGFIIAICSVGGMLVTYNEVKMVKAELKKRDN